MIDSIGNVYDAYDCRLKRKRGAPDGIQRAVSAVDSASGEYLWGYTCECYIVWFCFQRNTNRRNIDIALMLKREETEDMRERMTDAVVDLEL